MYLFICSITKSNSALILLLSACVDRILCIRRIKNSGPRLPVETDKVESTRAGRPWRTSPILHLPSSSLFLESRATWVYLPPTLPKVLNFPQSRLLLRYIRKSYPPRNKNIHRSPTFVDTVVGFWAELRPSLKMPLHITVVYLSSFSES